MPCVQYGEVKIYFPKIGERKIVYRICDSGRYKCAGAPRRRMKITHFDDYAGGVVIECLTCNRTWSFE